MRTIVVILSMALIIAVGMPAYGDLLRHGALLQEDEQVLEEVDRHANVVAGMLREGKSQQEIAAYVARIVDERIVAPNRNDVDEGGVPGSDHKAKKKPFDEWSKYFAEEVQCPWIAAHWAWKYRLGHCQEHSSLVYHLMMLGLHRAGRPNPGKQLRMYKSGDHVYVIWTRSKSGRLPAKLTAADFRLCTELCVIDAWVGAGGRGDQLSRDVKTLRQAEERRMTKLFGLRPKRTVAGGWIVRDDEMGLGRWFPTDGQQTDYSIKVYNERFNWWLTKAVNLSGEYRKRNSTDKIKIQQSGLDVTLQGNVTARGRVRGQRAYFDTLISGDGWAPIVVFANRTVPSDPMLRHMRSGVPAKAVLLMLAKYEGEEASRETRVIYYDRESRIASMPFRRCGGGLKAQLPSASGEPTRTMEYGCDSHGFFTGKTYTGTWSTKERTKDVTASVTVTVKFDKSVMDSVVQSFKGTKTVIEKAYKKGNLEVVGRTVTTVTATNLPLDKASPLLHIGLPIDDFVKNPSNYRRYRLSGRYLPLIYKIKGPKTAKHAKLLVQQTDMRSGETTTTSSFISDKKSEIMVIFMIQ